MVSLSTLTFLARSAAGRLTGIAGDTIAVALATLAEGLSRDGNINSDAKGSGTTVFTAGNSGSGVCDIRCDGKIGFQNGTGYRIDLAGTPTANRTVTFPDADITLGPSNFIGNYAKAYLQANTAFGAGTTAFCTDINGINGGTTGVLCYLGNNPFNGWLRFSNDSAI